jgi:hypothetical protein
MTAEHVDQTVITESGRAASVAGCVRRRAMARASLDDTTSSHESLRHDDDRDVCGNLPQVSLGCHMTRGHDMAGMPRDSGSRLDPPPGVFG